MSSRAAKRQEYINDNNNYATEGNYDHAQEASVVDQQAAQSLGVGGSGPGKNGYSQGSGLRSIAQGSADQANNAVLNQHAAANQAAYVAKNTLAQAANQVTFYVVTVF